MVEKKNDEDKGESFQKRIVKGYSSEAGTIRECVHCTHLQPKIENLHTRNLLTNQRIKREASRAHQQKRNKTTVKKQLPATHLEWANEEITKSKLFSENGNELFYSLNNLESTINSYGNKNKLKKKTNDFRNEIVLQTKRQILRNGIDNIIHVDVTEVYR